MKLVWLGNACLIVLILAGFNWGLVGFFNTNLVSVLLGKATLGAHIVYGLIAFAAFFKLACMCKSVLPS